VVASAQHLCTGDAFVCSMHGLGLIAVHAHAALWLGAVNALSHLHHNNAHCLPTNVRPPAGHEQVLCADAYVAALDVLGAQRLLPQDWRGFLELTPFTSSWGSQS
jgi:hypothetical protein